MLRLMINGVLNRLILLVALLLAWSAYGRSTCSGSASFLDSLSDTGRWAAEVARAF